MNRQFNYLQWSKYKIKEKRRKTLVSIKEPNVNFFPEHMQLGLHVPKPNTHAHNLIEIDSIELIASSMRSQCPYITWHVLLWTASEMFLMHKMHLFYIRCKRIRRSNASKKKHLPNRIHGHLTKSDYQ